MQGSLKEAVFRLQGGIGPRVWSFLSNRQETQQISLLEDLRPVRPMLTPN